MQPILFKIDISHVVRYRSSDRGMGPLVPKKKPVQPPIYIIGVTKDSTGAALANCSLELFRQDGTLVERLVSDGSGNYVTSPVGLGQLYQVDAYKTGSPDVAGTTVNTLQGA